MDAADAEPGEHGHRIEASLLPLKKRASNYNSGGGRISAGDPSASPSKKKKRMDDNNVVGAETMDTAGALEAPVPRQRRRPVLPVATSRELAAPAAASPAEPAAKGIALSESDEEKKRLSKGKWVAKEESSSLVTTQPPPVKKLMHDGIRSFIPQQLRHEHRRHAAAAAAAAIAVPPVHGASPALSPGLERRLAELGATRPWLVHSKLLQKSDVDENQNRLLVSCKRGGRGREGSPITRCFVPAELARVNNEDAGLSVTAFDRDGVPYALTCKFLGSNSGYRFIAQWKDFLTQNGMNLSSQKNREWKRVVEVELWAFRSRRLPFQQQLNAEGKPVKIEGEDGNKVDVTVSHHLDPDGALGLVLLHHETTRRVVVKSEEEEDDDEWKQGPSSPRPVARKKGKQQSGKKRGASASASASAAAVALPAPVAEQAGARWSEPTLAFCAALGLEKLRRSIFNEWKAKYGDGANGANDVAESSADVEGEKVKTHKSLGTHSIKERGASSHNVDSLGKGSVPFGIGGSKTSTEDMALS